MGQKVNPLCFRLGVTQRHRSHWFAKKTKYSQLVMEDHFLRKLITDQFPRAGILSVSILRREEKLDLEMVVTQPRVLILYGGPNLERLRQEWSEKIVQRRRRIEETRAVSPPWLGHGPGPSSKLVVWEGWWTSRLGSKKLVNPSISAPSIAAKLVSQLEERIPFRRAMKFVLKRAIAGQVKGIKIQVSGRLNGAEIARTEWLRKGRVPLQTLRARVDYTHTTA